MERFERKIVLPATPAQVFAWHAAPGAFESLCPPWQKIDVLQPAPELADETRVTFRVWLGPIPITWTAEHRDVIPGEQFCDVQISGPFRSWSHVHRFLPHEEGCLLSDEIDYELPLGAIGRLVAGRFIRADLDRMFDHRHRVTYESLSSGVVEAPD